MNCCEREGLGLFVTALSGMVATGDEEYRQISRRVQRYTNLKNVLNSYEYLLKTVKGGVKTYQRGVDVQRLCQGNGPAIMSVVAVSSQ